MAQCSHASDVAVTVFDSCAAQDVITEEGSLPSPDRHALLSSDRADLCKSDEELSSLLHGDEAAPIETCTSHRRHVPWFAWPLLVASLVAVSSAAVVFASIPDVPTFTLAAWRLQLTTGLLSPAAIYQYMQLPAGTALYTCLSLSHVAVSPRICPHAVNYHIQFD